VRQRRVQQERKTEAIEANPSQRPGNYLSPAVDASAARGNRYTQIFEFARDQEAARPAPRLLSFGYATGEEAFSPRRCFPFSSINGIEIDPANIAHCRALHAQSGGDPANAFDAARKTDGEPAANGDSVQIDDPLVRLVTLTREP
jgi:hypothetical protein